eukprot:Hpha_TRINITY_DN14684_c0_g1::TRINITY_DN14684_c0_g1_i1::g.47873::m.47873
MGRDDEPKNWSPAREMAPQPHHRWSSTEGPELVSPAAGSTLARSPGGERFLSDRERRDSVAGSMLRSEFESCMTWSDAADLEKQIDLEIEEDDEHAPVWDPSGRNHDRQCKAGAKQDPEAYYRDAYYMAYLAGARRGRDPANPFGYRYREDGTRYVISDGAPYAIMGEADFLELRELADSDEGWTLRSEDKKSMKNVAGQNGTIWVWDRPPLDRAVTSFNMVKVFCVIEGLEPWTLYDTLHDCVYRWDWDTNMLQGYNVCNLDLHNDVGYYAAQSPSSLVQSRDFCNQRAWRNVDGKEFIIMNKSRPHERCPPAKGFTRGASICSGYLIRPHGPGASSMTWIAQSDLKGSIPAWLINMAITGTVPKTMATISKVGNDYRRWKRASGHERHRPWVVPPEPWSRPQRNRLVDWLVDQGKLQLPRTDIEPECAPESWYHGTPALEWYAPGAPFGPARASIRGTVGGMSRLSAGSSRASQASCTSQPRMSPGKPGQPEEAERVDEGLTTRLLTGPAHDHPARYSSNRVSGKAPYDGTSAVSAQPPPPGCCQRCCIVQ